MYILTNEAFSNEFSASTDFQCVLLCVSQHGAVCGWRVGGSRRRRTSWALWNSARILFLFTWCCLGERNEGGNRPPHSLSEQQKKTHSNSSHKQKEPQKQDKPQCPQKKTRQHHDDEPGREKTNLVHRRIIAWTIERKVKKMGVTTVNCKELTLVSFECLKRAV